MRPLFESIVDHIPPRDGDEPVDLIVTPRARIVTRAAQADRTLNVAVTGNAGEYMYRYCVLTAGCDPLNPTGVLQYARARTLTIEVALNNQSKNYFY